MSQHVLWQGWQEPSGNSQNVSVEVQGGLCLLIGADGLAGSSPLQDPSDLLQASCTRVWDGPSSLPLRVVESSVSVLLVFVQLGAAQGPWGVVRSIGDPHLCGSCLWGSGAGVAGFSRVS